MQHRIGSDRGRTMSGNVASSAPSAELVGRVASVAPSAKLVTLIVRRRDRARRGGRLTLPRSPQEESVSAPTPPSVLIAVGANRRTIAPADPDRGNDASPTASHLV